MCSTSCVRQKLVCCSCVCHGLKAYLCILLLILDLLWRKLFSDFPFFTGMLLSRARPYLIVSFPLFSPFFTPSIILLPFIPLCYSCRGVIWSMFAGLLLGLLPVLFLMTQYGHWIYTYATLGFLDSLHYLWAPLSHFFPLWASLTHLLSLDILGPFFNSAFPWAFTNSFGLPQPNYLILHP